MALAIPADRDMAIPDAIAVLVLASVSWPLVRFTSIPSIRKEYSRLAFTAIGILAIWCVLIVVVALVAPGVSVAIAVLAAGLLIAERWRARVRYGMARGLPPGSLSLVPRGPWIDEKYYATQAARHGPVFKMSQFFRPMVCLMGPSEGVDLLEQHASNLYSPPVRFSRFIPRGYIRYMAPHDHAVYKPTLRTALNTRVLNDCSGDFRLLVAAKLGEMAAASRAARAGIQPAGYLADLGFQCMLRLFLGLGADAPEVPALRALYRKVEIGKAASRWRSADRGAANAIAACMEERLARKEDLPSCVLSELARTAGAHDRTVLLNLVYMIRISGSDLAGFLTWAVKILLDHPEWLERLRTLGSDGQDAQATELATLMLRETLRLERSEFIFRKTRAEIVFKGYRIPRDWIVRICIRDGHRDPRTFPDPEAFDPMRFSGRTWGKREYSPLGIGAHACLGGQTINVIGRIFLIELSRAFRASVVSDGDREYGRSHWQPSSAWRIAVAPLDEASVPLPRLGGQASRR